MQELGHNWLFNLLEVSRACFSQNLLLSENKAAHMMYFIVTEINPKCVLYRKSGIIQKCRKPVKVLKYLYNLNPFWRSEKSWDHLV